MEEHIIRILHPEAEGAEVKELMVLVVAEELEVLAVETVGAQEVPEEGVEVVEHMAQIVVAVEEEVTPEQAETMVYIPALPEEEDLPVHHGET